MAEGGREKGVGEARLSRCADEESEEIGSVAGVAGEVDCGIGEAERLDIVGRVGEVIVWI